MGDEPRAAGGERRERRASRLAVQVASPQSNKPMVPTALATTEERSPGSVRQHIGEPLGPARRAAGLLDFCSR